MGLQGFLEMVLSNVSEHAEDMDIKLFNVKDAALIGIGNIGLSFV